jgi:hypothetical protein
MGGDAGERCNCEVGDPRGECEEWERGLTYESLRSSFVISSFARSSWCTATLKRFQNCGSRTSILTGLWAAFGHVGDGGRACGGEVGRKQRGAGGVSQTYRCGRDSGAVEVLAIACLRWS